MQRFDYAKPCTKYSLDTGYQVCNGYIAIHNGGLGGVGLGNSTQKYLYLPEAHTDFIFPIICEELGLLVGIAVIVGYFVMLFIMLKIAKETDKTRGIRRVLTIEQQRAFMDYIANHPVYYHWWPMFTILLGTGCRIGEALGLRWEDLDFENRVISVNHSIVYYPIGDSRTSVQKISMPKTEAGIRTVPMLGAVAGAKLVSVQVVLYAYATVACSLLLIPAGGAGWVYTAGAVLSGAWFLAETHRLHSRAQRGEVSDKSAMKVFHGSISYLTILFVALAIDPFVGGPVFF